MLKKRVEEWLVCAAIITGFVAVLAGIVVVLIYKYKKFMFFLGS